MLFDSLIVSNIFSWLPIILESWTYSNLNAISLNITGKVTITTIVHRLVALNSYIAIHVVFGKEIKQVPGTWRGAMAALDESTDSKVSILNLSS